MANVFMTTVVMTTAVITTVVMTTAVITTVVMTTAIITTVVMTTAVITTVVVTKTLAPLKPLLLSSVMTLSLYILQRRCAEASLIDLSYQDQPGCLNLEILASGWLRNLYLQSPRSDELFVFCNF